MFALFLEFRARTRAWDLQSFLISESGLKFFTTDDSYAPADAFGLTTGRPDSVFYGSSLEFEFYKRMYCQTYIQRSPVKVPEIASLIARGHPF